MTVDALDLSDEPAVDVCGKRLVDLQTFVDKMFEVRKLPTVDEKRGAIREASKAADRAVEQGITLEDTFDGALMAARKFTTARTRSDIIQARSDLDSALNAMEVVRSLIIVECIADNSEFNIGSLISLRRLVEGVRRGF